MTLIDFVQHDKYLQTSCVDPQPTTCPSHEMNITDKMCLWVTFAAYSNVITVASFVTSTHQTKLN